MQGSSRAPERSGNTGSLEEEVFLKLVFKKKKKNTI